MEISLILEEKVTVIISCQTLLYKCVPMPADTKLSMSRIVVKQSFVLLLDICFNFLLFPFQESPPMETDRLTQQDFGEKSESKNNQKKTFLHENQMLTVSFLNRLST